MRNIPVFTTENGVASLILREIPYRRSAYCLIRDTQAPAAFAEECARFCLGAGAERVYATGHAALEQYPFHTSMLLMRRARAGLEETDASLFPVTEETVEEWRELCNRRMDRVPNAAWMTEEDGREMLKKGDGYFVHRDGRLLGIGRASGDSIDQLASAVPGGGRDTLLALAHGIFSDTICLTVASTNAPAMRLYNSLGFQPVRELSRWYILSPCQGKTLDKEGAL